MIRTGFAAFAVLTAAVIGLAPTAGADQLSDLWPLLPDGYNASNCRPGDAGDSGWAVVHCSGLPDGPNEAHFVMTESVNEARQTWRKVFAGTPSLPFNPVPCRTDNNSVHGAWGGGEIACGTDARGVSTIIYTNGPMFAAVYGNDRSSLLLWFGGAAHPA